MRILWVSNAPWLKTGYGTQTDQVVRRLAADGHEVAILANAGLDGKRINWNGVLVLPPGQTQYGHEVLEDHYDWWFRNETGWAISLYDVWTFQEAMLRPDLRIASWVPVEHDPITPLVAQWCLGHPSIAMSRFGQQQLANIGVDAHYVPHALEPEYRPTEALPSGELVRAVLGIPADAFLVMINATNTHSAMNDRKSWSEMFQAFAEIAKRHDDAYLYVHSATVVPTGIPLKLCAQLCGIPIDRIRWPAQTEYKSGDYDGPTMAALYTAADVLLATSRGEGFGIPVIEAQACGSPVIVSDFTAQPELVGAGWKVPVQKLMDPHGFSFWGLPLIPGIVDALEEAYQRKGDVALFTAAIEKAAEYGADKVYEENWRPVIADLGSRLAGASQKASRSAEKIAAAQAKRKRRAARLAA